MLSILFDFVINSEGFTQLYATYPDVAECLLKLLCGASCAVYIVLLVFFGFMIYRMFIAFYRRA